MSIRMKLISLVAAFVLVLGLVITGVLAASSQTITMNGSVNFNVTDKSLWVKEVRMQESGSDPVVVSNFTPGYINGDFNFNVGNFENNHGSFAIYFDIINTTQIPQHVSVDFSGLSISGLEVSITPEIASNSEELTEISSETENTTTLELIVTNPNLENIDLSKITINIEPFVLGELTYTYNEETMEATVTGCSEGAEAVVIPETVEYEEQTYTVTAIYAASYYPYSAFFSSHDTLQIVKLPNTLQSIGAYAFFSCSQLEKIAIPSSVTNISSSAFQYCGGLTSIAIPSSVTSIGNNTFNGCNSLTSITIPSSVTAIGAGAFSGCTSLVSAIFEVADGWTYRGGSNDYSISSSLFEDPSSAAYVITEQYARFTLSRL